MDDDDFNGNFCLHKHCPLMGEEEKRATQNLYLDPMGHNHFKGMGLIVLLCGALINLPLLHGV